MKHLSDEELAIYAESLVLKKQNKLTPNIINHIKECDVCATQAIELSFIFDENNLLKNKEKSKKIKHPHNKIYKYIAMAASVILLITLSFIIHKELSKKSTIALKTIKSKNYLLESKHYLNKNTEEKTKINISSQKPTEEKVKLAANFIPDENMEKIIQNFTSAYRGSNIIVKNKNLNVKKGQAIKFNWENNYEYPELTVEIYDNKAVNIESEKTTDSFYTVKQNLKEGLYYWKLFTPEFDLLYCGKFTVE